MSVAAEAAAARTAAERTRPRLTLRRRPTVALAVALPVLLLGVYVATNVSASLAQRSLAQRWERMVAAGPLDATTLGTRTFASGEPVARIRIAAVGLDVIAVAGGDGRRAPAHLRGSAIPGMPGLTAIAGNRFAFGNQFMNLDRLLPGDIIEVETLRGAVRFVVRDVGRLPASRIDTTADTTTPTLLLVAPASAWGGATRIVVTAEAVR